MGKNCDKCGGKLTPSDWCNECQLESGQPIPTGTFHKGDCPPPFGMENEWEDE